MTPGLLLKIEQFEGDAFLKDHIEKLISKPTDVTTKPSEV